MKPHLLALLLITGCVSSSTTIEPPNDPTAGSSAPEADAGMLDGIFGLHDSGTAWEDTDGGLVMVPQDADADAQEPLDAGTDAAADAEMPTLDAGHDAGIEPPPPGKTCDPCETDADCTENYHCQYILDDGASKCFLRASSPTVPPGGCYDLEPAGHLYEASYGPGNVNPTLCRPGVPCAQWKATYAGVSDY